MKLIEKTLSTQLKFTGRIINVRHDQIELPDGQLSMREVVEHPGGACIAAINENGELLLVEQFRYPFSMEMLEFPAGKLEHKEDPLEAAKRELIEETGYEALEIIPLGLVYPSVGYLSEIIHLYFVPQAQFVGQDLDVGEFLNVRTYTYSQLLDMVHNGIINDSKTIAIILRLQKHLNF
jgi:ADP-ribose pyrophosphatase